MPLFQFVPAEKASQLGSHYLYSV